MPQITRTWLGFAAIGAGLIHLALVTSSPLPVAVVLAGLGIAEFGWGVLTFARDRLVGPRIVRAAALAPVILWSLLVVGAALLDATWLTSLLPLIPMSIATILELFATAVLSGHLRRNQDPDNPPPTPEAPTAGRYLLSILAGGVLASALVTPALAATEAGRYAQSHGGHHAEFVPAQVDDDPLSDLVLPGHQQH
ncbi:MAG: hypothetical protein JWL94_960 [Microbacteriaceae bacterium]|nr:hypothetical protein [Microbacteriaceae bacterium]HEV7957785.1 hypothetical protein [Marisediminicola sp.]